jgi:hypothetical protein
VQTGNFTGPEEYFTEDRRFGMVMHTFKATAGTDRAKVTMQFQKRLQLLSRKLVEDLESGNKIFVYRKVSRDLTGEEIERLSAAMRLYGNPTLLYVCYATPEHPPGTVTWARDGLIIGGYIDRFAFSRSGERLGPVNEAWLQLCRAAFELRQARVGRATIE